MTVSDVPLDFSSRYLAQDIQLVLMVLRAGARRISVSSSTSGLRIRGARTKEGYRVEITPALAEEES